MYQVVFLPVCELSAECEVFPSVPCKLQLFPLKSVGGWVGGRKDGKACGDELF